MNNDWNDYPFSAFSAALRSAAGIGSGLIFALLAGTAIGFFGHGPTFTDTHDGFFFLYLFFIFPIHLLANLGRLPGFLAAMASLALLILHLKWESHKLEILALYTLSVGLCVFQSVGLDQQNSADMSWLRFFIGCAMVVCGYIAIRGVEFLWWKTRRR